MRKIIAALNLTIDGFCDHTAGIPDAEMHQHYTDLLNQADVILYGRTTFELMKFWQAFIENPSGEKAMDEFAQAIDNIHKIVFSTTMKNVDWESASLANQTIEQVISELKQQSGGPILIGSRSLIAQLTNLNLIDEYQLCIHPVVIGKGLPLFDKIQDRKVFKLLNIKIFASGAVIHYYRQL